MKMKTNYEMKNNVYAKSIESKEPIQNKFKSNYNLKPHVILIYCDPLLLFSMVMDKCIYFHLFVIGCIIFF